MKDFAIDSLLSMSPANLSAPPAYGPENKSSSFDEHLSRASRPKAAAEESSQTDSRQNALGSSEVTSGEQSNTDESNNHTPPAATDKPTGSTTDSNSSDATVGADGQETDEHVEEEGDEEDVSDEVILTQAVHVTQQELIEAQKKHGAQSHADAKGAGKATKATSAEPAALQSGAAVAEQMSGKTEVLLDEVPVADNDQAAKPTDETPADNKAKLPVVAVEQTVTAASETQEIQPAAQVRPESNGDGENKDRKSRERGGKSTVVGKTEAVQTETPEKRLQVTAEPEKELVADTKDADGKAEKSTAKFMLQPGSEHKLNDSQSQQPNGPARTNIESSLASVRNEQAPASGMSEVDRVRFVQRVARAFQAADEQGGSVRLRLSPPELGSMRLEVTVRDGVLTARMETETQAAKNLLLDHMPVLRERLAEQNIRVERFEVDLMNQNSGGLPDRPGENHQDDHQRQSNQAMLNRRSAESIAAPVATRRSAPSGGNSQLNVVI